MEYKKRLLSLVFALVCFAIIGNPNALAGENWIEIDSKNETDVNKPWTITFSKEVDATSITDSNIYIENASGEEVPIKQPEISGDQIKISPVQSYTIGQSYTMYMLSSIKSVDGEELAGNTKFIFNISSTGTEIPVDEDVQITKAGEYGNTTYNGDVTITSPDVTLKNAVIKGDLIVAESVGEGEVYFDSVTVEGETKIVGGGENSVYFTDSVLATVIVNKNTGAIRVVVQGNSRVEEVYLESAATLQETNVTGDGFKNIAIQESAQNSDGQIQLVGTFDTINVRATNVEIKLDQATSIEELVLSATAQVTGQGSIHILNVGANAAGSSIETRPHSAVIDISSYVEIAGEEVTSSYSDAKEATIQSITATPAYIKVKFDQSITGLTAEDFHVTATQSGRSIPLTGITYNSNANMIFFNPIPVGEYDEIHVTVQPSTTNSSLSGSASTTYSNVLGFAGRITDIYGIGVPNVTVTASNDDDYYSQRSLTDENGYYFVPTYYAGVFEGKISGPGYLDGTILATVTSNVVNANVNETIMRAASSNEWKIMLTWNGEESDIDSHLASDYFHVYYGDREYYGADGYEYVDLDWDDVDYYGPETTTIRKFQDGRYIFFLHNYSGSKPISLSDSKVQVFKGNSTDPDYVFNVPSNTEDARYWGVFELVVTDQGRNVTLQTLDTIAYSEDALIYPKKAVQSLLEQAKSTNEGQVNLVSAIQQADSVLSNTNATTKQLLEAYNELYKVTPKFAHMTSWFETLEVTTQVEESIDGGWNLIYKLGNDIKWKYKTVETYNDYNVFTSNDDIELSLTISEYGGYYDLYPITGLTIKAANHETGEEQVYTTDHQGKVSLGTYSYDEFFNLAGGTLQFLFEEAGYYEVSLEATAVNRTDYYGYEINDSIYREIFVRE